jgi:hypothetical protein
MGSPFSVDDTFTVEVSFDLLGGYLLGRGLYEQHACHLAALPSVRDDDAASSDERKESWVPPSR